MENINKIPQLLFVEDDSTIRKMICFALRSSGMEVTEAQDGKEALSCFQLQPEKYDVVITDLSMPHMDGNELTASLKNSNPQPLVIMCTATPAKEIGETQADAVLKKPYDIQELIELTRQTIQGRRRSGVPVVRHIGVAPRELGR